MFLVFVAVAVLALCVYYYLMSNYDYWKKRGIPNPPVSVLFGNIGESIFFKKSLGQIYSEVYDNYSHLSYVGFFKARQPSIIVRDPDLIRDVLVKNFNSFHDNDFQVDEKADPLFSKNPFVLRGPRWKVTRNQASPSFTSKKIKEMFPLMESVCNQLVKYLEETPIGEDGIEAKDFIGKYTTDVVATCAFGLEANSFKDPNAEFRTMGKKVFNPSLLTAIKFLIFTACPPIASLLEIKLVPDDVSNYFCAVIEKSLKYRKTNNLKRGDFLDDMVELKNKLGETTFTNHDITAHALGFFIDGYETSSVVISFMMFELASNSDVQDTLREEIEASLRRNGGKFTYDSIQEMSYLDKVFNETLRMHPAVLYMARVCTERCILPHPSGVGSDVTIEPETRAIIPLYGIHMDPKYYPDPERFDPERFSEANKEVRSKNTFFGFGDGPRACLGQRFGVAQSKMAVAYVVADFEIRVNRKTITPIEIDPQYFFKVAKGGLWLEFHKRR